MWIEFRIWRICWIWCMSFLSSPSRLCSNFNHNKLWNLIKPSVSYLGNENTIRIKVYSTQKQSLLSPVNQRTSTHLSTSRISYNFINTTQVIFFVMNNLKNKLSFSSLCSFTSKQHWNNFQYFYSTSNGFFLSLFNAYKIYHIYAFEDLSWDL